MFLILIIQIAHCETSSLKKKNKKTQLCDTHPCCSGRARVAACAFPLLWGKVPVAPDGQGLSPGLGQRSSWLNGSESGYSQDHSAERCSPRAQPKMPLTEVDISVCSILLFCGPGLPHLPHSNSLHVFPGPHHLRGGDSMPKHCLEHWTEAAEELKIIWGRTVLSFKWTWLFIQEIVFQVESCEEPFSALPFSTVIWMKKWLNSEKNQLNST